jgi:hypothetical protein
MLRMVAKKLAWVHGALSLRLNIQAKSVLLVSLTTVYTILRSLTSILRMAVGAKFLWASGRSIPGCLDEILSTGAVKTTSLSRPTRRLYKGQGLVSIR